VVFSTRGKIIFLANIDSDCILVIMVVFYRPTVGLFAWREIPMIRVLKEPAIRRNEILDAGQRILFRKGYEQMTIQNILDDTQISKGAFYHYFDSKQALLEGLIERMGEEGIQLIRPILTDPKLNALQKLNIYFDSAMRWKTDQIVTLIPILRVWYSDDNSLLRQKELAAGKKIMVPLLTDVLRQGSSEGLLGTPYPEQMAEVLVSLIMGLSDALGELILVGQAGPANLIRVEAVVAAYTYSVERTIGAAPSSLKLIDMEKMKQWFL
jgi:TetR/AcrR family transcriptional regulator, transcriptional repressor for nem operon